MNTTYNLGKPGWTAKRGADGKMFDVYLNGVFQFCSPRLKTAKTAAKTA